LDAVRLLGQAVVVARLEAVVLPAPEVLVAWEATAAAPEPVAWEAMAAALVLVALVVMAGLPEPVAWVVMVAAPEPVAPQLIVALLEQVDREASRRLAGPFRWVAATTFPTAATGAGPPVSTLFFSRGTS
jgi:hypothetical protein